MFVSRLEQHPQNNFSFSYRHDTTIKQGAHNRAAFYPWGTIATPFCRGIAKLDTFKRKKRNEEAQRLPAGYVGARPISDPGYSEQKDERRGSEENYQEPEESLQQEERYPQRAFRRSIQRRIPAGREANVLHKMHHGSD